MKIFQDIPLPSVKDLFQRHKVNYANSLILTGSGKASISLILRFLREKNIIQNKAQEVLVPKWLGYWVYNQINQHCFPTNVITPETKAVLLYHQFGIPQDESKWHSIIEKNNLVVIEDCAHLLRSPEEKTKYNFTIFSYSKFFFCFSLGGIQTKEELFPAFAQELQRTSPSWKMHLINIAKFCYENARKNGVNPAENSLTGSFLNATYSWYGASFKCSELSKKLFHKKINLELATRESRFLKLRDTFMELGRVSYLKNLTIAPYAFPLDVNEKEARLIQDQLLKLSIKTGVYNFDTNRFYLEPHYKRVILLYLHSEIPDSIFNSQIEICKNIIKSDF